MNKTVVIESKYVHSISESNKRKVFFLSYTPIQKFEESFQICWFGAQETFLITINIENSCVA